MDMSEEIVSVSSSRLRSAVWKDFDRVKKGETFYATCRHCHRMLNGSSTSGTTHLRNHLMRCRGRLATQDASQLLTRGRRKQNNVAPVSYNYSPTPPKKDMVCVPSMEMEQGIRAANSNSGSYHFDHRRSQLDLARMIIMHGYPLDMVENAGFKRFVQNLQPLFDLVKVVGVEADCMEIYNKEKQKVYEELDKLPGKISLSVDRWVNGETEWLCLRAHYIDDSWELKKKILNFLAIDPFQAEDMLSEVIMSTLRNWDIDRKLFSLTFDDSHTYDKIVGRISDQLCQHRFLMCEGKLFDVRCAASTVKLLVLDVLETSREIINKVRETIRHVRSSQETQEKFDETVQLNGINGIKSTSLDNQLQWNSTYMMLEVALEYKDVFSQLQEQDPDFVYPSSLDWDRLRAITSILKFFHEVSNVFAGNKHITANTYFAEICDIHLQLIEWCQKSDDFIRSLSLRLKSTFDEYWKKCSLIMAVAAILDPRFKMRLVEYYYPQIYAQTSSDCIEIVSQCMKVLYQGHAIYSPLAAYGQCSTSDNTAGVVKDRLTGFDRFLHENSLSQHTKSDLDKYLEEPLFPRSIDFDILNWWKVHEARYPVLSMMARNILGIPVSKVSLESLFDTGDRSLNHCWSSLKSDTLQALMCSQDWLRN